MIDEQKWKKTWTDAGKEKKEERKRKRLGHKMHQLSQGIIANESLFVTSPFLF
jgi:hypothetical protein